MGQVLNSGFAQIPCHSIVEQGDGLRTMTALAKRVIMVLKIFKNFLFTCTALNDIRTDEYVKLERQLISMNRIDVWELFMSSNLDVKLNLKLGSDVLINPNKCDADNIAIIFDDFCNYYTKRAWKLRADLRN